MLSNMKNEKVKPDEIRQETRKEDKRVQFGIVRSAIENKYAVEVAGVSITASKAISCLITPLIADYISFITDGKRSFITAVLERETKTEPVSIKTEQDLTIDAPNVKILGKNTLSLTSSATQFLSSELAIGTEKLELTATDAETRVNRLTHVGKTLKTILSDILLRASVALRVIDTTDHQKAKQISINADKHLSLKGDLTSIIGKSDVKVDAERVHLG